MLRARSFYGAEGNYYRLPRDWIIKLLHLHFIKKPSLSLSLFSLLLPNEQRVLLVWSTSAFSLTWIEPSETFLQMQKLQSKRMGFWGTDASACWRQLTWIMVNVSGSRKQNDSQERMPRECTYVRRGTRLLHGTNISVHVFAHDLRARRCNSKRRDIRSTP